MQVKEEMKMCPEKSFAPSEPRDIEQVPTFMSDLKALYKAAGGGSKEFTYTRLIRLADQAGYTVAKSNISDWFNKNPPQDDHHVEYVMKVLIPFLEDRAASCPTGHAPMSEGAWGRRLRAAQEVSTGGQGGRGRRVHAASQGRLLGGPSQALLNVLPADLEEREREMAELKAFVTAPAGSPSYLWWQADPWAGKTALVAWFAARRLPAGVDVAHHIIAGRLDTDRRDDFVQAVGTQLAAAAGKRRPALDRMRPNLHPLYEDAAHASKDRGRRLVLIVDGLDEDADVSLASAGIAGLLPKVPPHEMRVIVTGRPYPTVPAKLAQDHPLRTPSIVRRLTPSPAARVIRDTATVELQTLLKDRDIGRRLLGLLVVARGALTGADLSALIAGTIPNDIQEMLATVAGRSLVPTRVDRLPLHVRTEAEAEAGRQTFVLGHATLYETARDSLGEPFLTGCVKQLDSWARQYEEAGWPEDTPNYLLTGYTRLVQEDAGIERFTALVLDPRRQLRLVQNSGVDVALAQLDLLTPPDPVRPQHLDLAAAATAAVSRDILLAHVTPLPLPVVQTIARLGDARRARALARASGRAVDKALNMTGVAQVLQGGGDEQAADTAREATKWAHAALRETDRLGYPADEVAAAAAQAALALLETARPPRTPEAQDPAAAHRQIANTHARPQSPTFGVPGTGRELRGQVEDGLLLLRSTLGTATVRNEAWAAAAQLLKPDHPQDAAELLDELEEQAQTLAAADPTDTVAAASAIQLWQTLASAAPEHADRIHDRVLAHATTVWEAAPTLENVCVIAGAASLMALTRPAQAGQLVATACRYLEQVLHTDAGPPSPADAFHLEFGFRHTLTVLSQALTDVRTPLDTAARVLDLGASVLPPEPAEESVSSDFDNDEDRAFHEATKLADQALQLAGNGAVGEAEHQLEKALALLPSTAPGSGRSPIWLPDLMSALVRTAPDTSLEPLLDLVRHPADQVRVHAAIALACTDSLQMDAARHHAQAAARALSSPDVPATSWAHAAQALASAGDVDSALHLITQHRQPDGTGQRVAWRKADRAVRIAVATELAGHEPQAAAELLLPLLNRLTATRHVIRSTGLLTSLAELLPATAHLPAEQQLLDTEIDTAGEHMTRSSPQTWHPEDVLVHAFLHLKTGQSPERQVDWLTRDMANRGTEHFPTTALALLHTALGDTTTAQQVATLSCMPHHKAAALTAVASHLTRTPYRPCTTPDPTTTDPLTRTLQHLALTATPTQPPAPEAAAEPVRQVLSTTGWHHAIPVLAQLAPQAITAIHHTTLAHQRTPQNR
ncbi:hypothetical protein [Streptomyces sp. DT195]|uniref:hypothetical protein n=1 Tax=Streptomyces sp. DT195 TaxID=3393419 RepID=UPI003CF6DC5C